METEIVPQLEVGDEVIYWNDFDFRYVRKVEKVTPKFAILDCGTKVKRQPKWNTWSRNHCWAFAVYGGDRFEEYQLLNDEIRAELAKQKHTHKIKVWFSNQKFTDEQKEQIYNLFNPTLQGE